MYVLIFGSIDLLFQFNLDVVIFFPSICRYYLVGLNGEWDFVDQNCDALVLLDDNNGDKNHSTDIFLMFSNL